MRAAVSPIEERRRGSGTGDEAWESRADRMLGKRERTVHEDGECGMMPWPRENGVLMGPTQIASIGHVAK